MKKRLSMLAAGLLAVLGGFAQDKVNLVIFSEDGDPFYAYVNGIRQNDKPETNVRVTGLSPNVSLRVEFENKALPQLKQNLPLNPGYESTVRIRRDAKKQVKLAYGGEVPISDEPVKGRTDIPFHNTENPTTVQNGYNTSNGNENNTNVSSSSTVTTNSMHGEDVNMNVNMGGMGINMSVNTTVPANNVTTTSSSTITTRTSGNTQQVQSNVQDNNFQNQSANSQVTTAKAGCAAPMSQPSFIKMKQSVESKPFSDTKMSTAKIATKNNCVSSAQVKEICKLFSMDDDKLTYAKYAYEYCVDKGNYYTVSEVFSFSSTTDEFNKFLEQ